MTDRQREVRDFIVSFSKANGFAPTIRDIGNHFGVQVNAIKGILDRLAAEGVVQWNARQSRTLRVIDGA